ncbi:hypothetical protein [Enhydrobacter sp.]|jgi:Cu/Ag efflux protein CusF|uniref:hypothetical protein n=1 Tax=Enhydrobacter sp. TaxID=1894999 RepID=UPI00260497A1|nr:hypothetical protein [Enhydrobacter sp.]WIM14353.1 MAG: hypothetical protein OJF58_005323 [Enhydrobacter sp.]
MTIGPIKAALGATLVGAALALATALPAAAQGNLQAVPRAGVSFANTVTTPATIKSIDKASRTVTFTTAGGATINAAAADSIGNLDRFPAGTAVDVSYNEVVNVLNLRQKGPGSRLARQEAGKDDAADTAAGRFTMTVVGVDLATNKVSLVDSAGGEVHTYAATEVATQDMLKKIKPGDTVIGLRTPLMVTAITPAK